MATNEALSYEVRANLENFNKQMKSLLVTAKTTNQNVVTSFKNVDNVVKDLEKTMDRTGKKFGKSFSLGTSEISKDMKRIVKDQKLGNESVVKSWRKSEKEVEKFEKSIKGTSKAVKTGFSDMKASSDSLTSTLKKLAAGYLGIAGAKKILNEVVNLTKKVVAETGILQTAGEKWEIFTGSVESAQIMLKQLYDFSHRTPFTFKDVNKAATQLFVLTDGALQGVDAIKQMADRAALAKVPMSQLTTWWGRLYSGMQSGKPIGRALTRMQQLGIVSGKLRNEIDALSKEDMMNGKGWEMFIEGTSKAEGAIDRLSKTIEGKLSTLEGVWDALFAFDDKKSQDAISSQIQNMIDVLNANTPIIQDILKDMFGVVSDIMTGAMLTVIDIYKYLNPDKAGLSDYNKTIATVSNQVKNYTPDQLKKSQSSLQKKGFDLRSQFAENARGTRGAGGVSSGMMKIIMEEQKMAMLTGDVAEIYRNMHRFDESTQKLMKEYIQNSAILKATNKQLEISNDPKTIVKKAVGMPGMAGFTGGVSVRDKKTKKTKLTKLTKNSLYSMEDVFRGLSAMNAPSIDQIGKNLEQTELYQIGAKKEGYEKFIYNMGKNINSFKSDKEVEQLNEEDRKKALAAQLQYYASTEEIINTSQQAIVNIHEMFAINSFESISNGMGLLASNTKSILGSLTNAGVGGLAGIGAGFGIAGAALGVVSTIAGLFSSSDENSTQTSNTSTLAAERSRPDIVSSGPDTVIVNNNIDIKTGYIGSDQGVTDFFYNKLSPLIVNSASGRV